MRAAVDTNVLFDLLAGSLPASLASREALSAASSSGPLTICPVVYTELAAGFQHQEELLSFLRDLGIRVEPLSTEALWRAAEAWKAYAGRRGQKIQCPRCGETFASRCPVCQSPLAWRQHLITDFLIGGHATAQADLLITRDSGYFRTYFPDLKLVAPPS